MKKLVHYKKIKNGKVDEEYNDPSLFDAITPMIKAMQGAPIRAIDFSRTPQPCNDRNNGEADDE